MNKRTCPLCGGSMHDAAGGCASCPIGRGCDLICCDHCGYRSVAPRSRVLDFFKKFRKQSSAGAR